MPKRAVILAIAMVFAGGILGLAQGLGGDGSVVWPVEGPGGDPVLTYAFHECPPPMVVCGPCMGTLVRCCYGYWVLRGWFPPFWCQWRELFCWWQRCDDPIPMSVGQEPL